MHVRSCSIRLLLALFLLQVCFYGFLDAHEDHYYNSLLGPDMVVGSSVNVQESLYLFEDGDLYDVVGSYGLVKLRYDYEADEVFFGGGSWPLVVSCAVIWYDRYGVMHKESISLEIDPGSGEINDLIRIEGAHRLHATLKSISGGPSSGLPSHVFLEGEIHTERYFTIDGPQPGLYNVALSLTDQSLAEISWSHIFGAEFYELEWVVLDDADGDIAAAPGSYDADFSRASRLQIRETDYTLSLAYPQSAIAYRLRPVYRFDKTDPGGTGSYYYGPWSTDPLTSGNIDEVPLGGSLATGDYQYFFAGLDTDRNWQFSRVYAEWGKSKEVITYADGTLRTRQTVTRLNTEDETVLSEIIYDYHGRPTVEMLPFPTGERALKFYEGQHLNTNSNLFSAADFDVDDANGDPFLQPALSTSAGAAKYYSPSNERLSGTYPADNPSEFQQHHLPDANGYVYTRSLYLNDGTGRIRMQSGIGELHRIVDPVLSDPHQTQYFYTGTNKGELYRLFGPQVGDPSHYTKQMVADANGQISVSYTDMHGRTIATALAGKAPDNLVELSHTPEVIETPLELDLPSDPMQTMHSNSIPIAVSSVTTFQDFTFDYDLGGSEYFNDCADFCATCSYIVRFELTDPDGDAVGLDPTQTGSGVNLLTTLPGQPNLPLELEYAFVPAQVAQEGVCLLGEAGGSLSFTASLIENGNFNLIRTIELNTADYQTALDTFNANHNFCGLTFASTVDQTDCIPGCLDAAYAALDGTINNPGPTVDQLNDWLAAHSNPSEIADWMALNCDDGTAPTSAGDPPPGPSTNTDPCLASCENLLLMLSADVSPGGQYFTDNTWLEAAIVEMIAASSSSLPTDFTLTSNMTAADFRSAFFLSAFQQDWIDEGLVIEHPEYCHYESCMETDMLASCSFDNWLRQDITATGTNAYTNTLSSPQSNSVDLDDPLVLADFVAVDPFFATNNIGAGQQSGFFAALQNYPDGNVANDDIIEVAEDLLADILAQGLGTPTVSQNGTLDSFDEWEQFRDMYLGLKQSYISQWSATTGAGDCPYLSPVGGGLTTLDGKTIRVPDPDFGAGAGFANTANLPGSFGDLCEDQCSTQIAFWLEQLNQCIVVTEDKGVNPPVITYSLAGEEFASGTGYSLTYGGMSLAEWIIYGGTYNGTPLTGLADLCEANCLALGDFSGCLPDGEVETTIDAVVSALLNDPALDLDASTYPPGGTWMQALTQCLLIPDCIDQPYSCDCERLNLSNSLYEQDLSLTALEELLLYNNMLNPSAQGITLTASLFDDQVTGWYARCLAGTLIQTDLPLELRCAEWGPEPGDTDPCSNLLSAIDTYNITQLQNSTYEEALEVFESGYFSTCWQVSENLSVTYELDEYHYTLYYYDQAGSLVQTVPPEGVDVLSLTPAQIDCIDTYKATGSSSCNINDIRPDHTFETRYQYNSYNHLIAQHTPDGGDSHFYYDNLGRQRFSQNAKQETDGNWAYTLYDKLSRVRQVGLYAITDAQTAPDPLTKLNDAETFPASAETGFLNGSGFELRDISWTFYSQNQDTGWDWLPNNLLESDEGTLRNRIGLVIRQDLLTTGNQQGPDFATHYTYDIAGNVTAVLQANHMLRRELDPTASSGGSPADVHAFKRTDYDFDLVSGNVNAVHYQDGKPDQYHHYYRYDADNRITHAFSSKDGVIKDLDARYLYYRHGPLARVEIGEDLVQGMDYLYTLHGWIKGVNGSRLLETQNERGKEDPGRDGYLASGLTVENLNRNFASDVMGYQLNYYGQDQSLKDYQAIGRNMTYVEDPLRPVNGALQSGREDLYNGNIGSMITGLYLLNSSNVLAPTLQGMAYAYDQLNRIKEAQAFDNFNFGTQNWDANAGSHDDYHSLYSYDGNGNLTDLTRKGHRPSGSGATLEMDQLSYEYDPGTNRLRRVGDLNSANCLIYDDIKDQPSQNYGYDQIGQLTSDQQAGIETIEWDLYNKIRKITFDLTTLDPCTGQAMDLPNFIEFKYDGQGNRISKKVRRNFTINHYTYYLRDASGNVMSIYQRKDSINLGTPRSHLWQAEAPIYGSSRLGLHKTERLMEQWNITGGIDNLSFTSTFTVQAQAGHLTEHTRILGRKYYELSNHLGNVLTTISDRKVPVLEQTTTIEYFTAEIMHVQDYYPFGMPMPGRTYEPGDYRYGFNGKEQDPETYGVGNIYDYGFRIYNPRIARFLSVDPLSPEYPWYTPYQFASNSPIQAIDLDGLEGVQYDEVDTKGNLIRKVVEVDVYVTAIEGWDKKATGRKVQDGLGRTESFYMERDISSVKKMLDAQYNGEENSGRKNSSGETVFFKFNMKFKQFSGTESVTDNKIKDLAYDLRYETSTPALSNISIPNPKRAERNFWNFLKPKYVDNWQPMLIDGEMSTIFSVPAFVTLPGSAGAYEEGNTSGGLLKISLDNKNNGGTLGHEFLHFFLGLYDTGEHHNLGGLLDNPPKGLSTSNIDVILQYVPKAKDPIRTVEQTNP